ncbi:MAG: 4Fe-4S binding protein [Bacteroides sp.]|nr:4Fe-4S binding protein [Bacteroides sp.]
MKIDNVHLITFSPTQTSKRVGEAIVRGIGSKNIKIVDLTCQELSEYEVPATDLALITVPVYGGKVAPLALHRLEGIRSNGAPVVLVVVYGNRAYEKALQQLDAFVSERGFKVISGGTFIGEHSYSTDTYPIAAGRPDEADLQFAEEYGQKILTKIEQVSDLEHLYGVDVLRIQRPSQPIWPMLRFVWQLSKWRKQGVVMPRAPQIDADLCTLCGSCVEVCPTQAIAVNEECTTQVDKCIKCCACIKCCPQKARTLNTPYAPLLSENFKKRKQNRIIV